VPEVDRLVDDDAAHPVGDRAAETAGVLGIGESRPEQEDGEEQTGDSNRQAVLREEHESELYCAAALRAVEQASAALV
jgi:hypothetical protein